jgi:hypothetical protein
VIGELMEAEVAELAGPKGKHNRHRSAYRHGTEDGKVTLGGRRVGGDPAPGAVRRGWRWRRRGAAPGVV